MENYKLGSLVGKGVFGDVYVAIDRRSNKRVAVKKVSKNKIPDMSEMERVLQEFSILVTLNNRNVIKLMEVVSDAQGIGLVMEFAGVYIFTVATSHAFLSLLTRTVYASSH